MDTKYEKSTYANFEEFYPFYLSQHRSKLNRKLHTIGTSLVILILLYILFTQKAFYIIFLPLTGYSFAWVGHFFIEKNKPATFKFPFYSLYGDFVMFSETLTGSIDKTYEKFNLSQLE